ncbi:unnamed protein product [Paramecium pentaurelia]|uniref:Transmembrane protein n=1 Tax=Paramecium pentaurelia TaxID=43138 RepID=A0A8S1TDD3_9CILI|nr:unnamed protein product [Paramecium pentaurelia]
MKFKLLFVILVYVPLKKCQIQNSQNRHLLQCQMAIIRMQLHIQAMKDQKNHGLYSFWLHGVRVVIEQLKFWKKLQQLTMVQQILVQQIRINKHQQRYNQELIGDRIGITKYPTFVFFDTDNKTYFIMNLLILVILLNLKMKRNIYIQNLMTLQKKLIISKMVKKNILVPVYVVVAFIVVLTSLCIFGNKLEKKDKSEVKRVKLELYRKSFEQQEREEYLKKKRD